jgi:hypothetical protein
MYVLVTGESGSGRHYYNQTEAEKYVIEKNRCVYCFPFKGFEIRLPKEVQLNRLVNYRRSGIYQVVIPDTHDKSDLLKKYMTRVKNCLIIIPACPNYLDIIKIALTFREVNDNDIIIVRDTIKGYTNITNILPDVYRIHADNTLQIHKLYASELSAQIGDENAFAFLIAQWIVNLQQSANQKSDEDMYKLGYFLYLIDGKIITASQDIEYTETLREFILSEATELVKARFGMELPDADIRNDLLNFLD